MKYSRLDRKKNSPELNLLDKGGMLDLFDNAMKEVFCITDNEYDILAENMSSHELDLLLMETLTYKEAKELLLAINKRLENG